MGPVEIAGALVRFLDLTASSGNYYGIGEDLTYPLASF
jgi:hypothetical protein